LWSRYQEQIRQAASQEERNRLARDLHDSVKQQLFVIQTAAATVQARFDADTAGAKAALDEVRTSAREAMTEMEVMLDQLQAAPLENVGLVEALKKQCEALRFRTGAQVDLDIGSLPPSEVLGPGSQEAIFRVAQEALANVGRHARARNVTVVLRDEGKQVRLIVRDDGAGYDPDRSPRGMGIAGMRARAEEVGGTLDLQQIPTGGTSVSLSIPYSLPLVKEYRGRAIYCGALMMFWAVVSVSMRPRPSPSFALHAAITLVAAVAFARNLYAYLRARKQAEALR
jgi:signal transduction histidine kinase